MVLSFRVDRVLSAGSASARRVAARRVLAAGCAPCTVLALGLASLVLLFWVPLAGLALTGVALAAVLWRLRMDRDRELQAERARERLVRWQPQGPNVSMTASSRSESTPVDSP